MFNRLLWRKQCVFLGQNLIIDTLKGMNHNPRKLTRYRLYRWAFRHNDFYETVNSPDLIDFYSDMFSCSKERLKLVYDAMRLTPQEQANAERPYDGPPYIFCGGGAYRDIPTFLTIVRSLPQVQFRAIFPARLLTPEMDTLPNLSVQHDVPSDTFYDVLSHATLCVIPLKSEAPCGLLVMQHAALMGIPIVSTRTRSMRTVVPDDDHGFLLPMGDAPAMVARIEQLLNDPSLAQRITANARANMSRFTIPAVAQQLADVMHEVMPQSVPKVTVQP